jgi:RNA-dependent RNA polymerase
MVNDHLGKICNAHVVHADQSELGALDPKCQQLAMLAAIAVDSPKTGRRVNLPAHLRPKMYPDFMDKQDRPCYHSEKILGYLFRKVKRAAEKEIELSSRLIGSPGTRIEQWYDKDLEMDGYKKYVADAWKLKVMYDVRLTALMDQFDVKAEGEVVSGHLTTFASKSNSRVKGDLNDRLKRMYTHLRDEFRTAFEQLPLHTGDDDQGSKKTEEEKQLHRDKELECKASAWYHVTYSPDLLRQMKEADPEKVLLLSFPWIAYDYLSRIKKRKKAEYDSYYNLIQSVGALSH